MWINHLDEVPTWKMQMRIELSCYTTFEMQRAFLFHQFHIDNHSQLVMKNDLRRWMRMIYTVKWEWLTQLNENDLHSWMRMTYTVEWEWLTQLNENDLHRGMVYTDEWSKGFFDWVEWDDFFDSLSGDGFFNWVEWGRLFEWRQTAFWNDSNENSFFQCFSNVMNDKLLFFSDRSRARTRFHLATLFHWTSGQVS
jgi:hypothetical protein